MFYSINDGSYVLLPSLGTQVMSDFQFFEQVSLTQSPLALKKQKYLPPMVSDDIDEQLELLLPAYEPPLFIYDQIKHFPRYLAALRIRIEKYTQRQEKDAESLKGLKRLQDKWIERVIEFVENDEEVPDMYVDFQYALQELRVSLFAQELKTLYPISQKRVEKQWHEIMLK